MLKKIESKKILENLQVKIKDTEFNKMFKSGLEYAALARGTWNISHVGMLIPESHQIFVCAANCLRGVVLTAAEIHSMDRFSTIEVKENMLYDGSMEYVIIDGVIDIVEKLDKKPKVVLVYLSCLHHFLGIDIEMIFKNLNDKYDDIEFIDCYMNPTLRKSGLTPDELMRIRLYRALKKKNDTVIKNNVVSIIGNDFPLNEESEIYKILKSNNIILKDITRCKNFDEYLSMAESSAYIYLFKAVAAAGDDLTKRLGGKNIFISNSFDFDEIIVEIKKLCEFLNIKNFDKEYYDEKIKICNEKIIALKKIVGNKKISIDYTYTTRILSLAKLLLDNGFNVDRIYADAFQAEEINDFLYIKEKYPNVNLFPTANPIMLYANDNEKEDEYLAIGQKAAYFSNTNHFVNIVEGGGMFGFEGIIDTLDLMGDAYLNKKNMRELVKIKGLGCEECIRC